MMQPQELINNILSDVRVELLDEFDRNLTRKAFFNKGWAKRKYDDGKGSLMNRTGALRRSLHAKSSGTTVTFYTKSPYALIHNAGGSIIVTRRMKRFFWAMYYKYSGKVKTLKSGRKSTSASSRLNNSTAEFYKAMALKKVGSRINMPQRQFIGPSPDVERIIRSIIEDNVTEYFNKFNIQQK